MGQNYDIKTENIPQELTALRWLLDHGVDEVLQNTPIDRTAIPDLSASMTNSAANPAPQNSAPQMGILPKSSTQQAAASPSQTNEEMMGAAQAIIESQKIAASCDSLDELKKAIENFDGLSVKKTATNMVFSDGDPNASIMLVGEAPGAEEDIHGKPFAGAGGQLLDRILNCVNLGRDLEDTKRSVYISNILNWRPPGNRTPTQAEMDISQAFIQRHIALVKPKMLILCGGVTAKTILKRSESISKLRGSFHDYSVEAGETIIAMVTYHPDYLLRTPSQKKVVWADMLMLQEKLSQILP